MNNSLKYNTESKDRWSSIPLGNGKIGALVQATSNSDLILKTQFMICCTFCEILPKIGSRGGAICTQSGKEIAEDEYYRNFAVVTDKDKSEFVPLREIPDLNYSFEAEWNRYNAERGISLG